MCLPVWRELKHELVSGEIKFSNSLVYMCLPVWRELKPSGVLFARNVIVASLHVPSRLEGVETSSTQPQSENLTLVYMCLPVRRELKQQYPSIQQRICCLHVYMCLPVRRELKQFNPY